VNPVLSEIARDIKHVLEEAKRLGVPEQRVSRVENILKSLEEAKAPLLVTRDLLNYYAYLNSLIQELEAGLRSGIGEFEINVFLDKVEEGLTELAGIIGRSYLREKIQLSIPIAMALLSYTLLTVLDPSAPNIVSLALSAIGAGIFYFSTLGGLLSVIATVASNILLSIVLNDLHLDLLVLETLILVSTVFHIYIVREATSRNYVEKVFGSIHSINSLVSSYIRHANVNDVSNLLNTIANSSATGLTELLRYKAAVMLMNGYSIEDVRKTLGIDKLRWEHGDSSGS